MLIQAIPDDILGVTQVKSDNRFFRPESVEKGDLCPLPAFSIYQLSSIIFNHLIVLWSALNMYGEKLFVDENR